MKRRPLQSANACSRICSQPDHVLQSISRIFRALGEPTRLKLIQEMNASERTVNQLVAATGISQPNASKHLSLLYREGLVRRQRHGRNINYSMAGSTVWRLVEAMRACFKRATGDLS